LLKTLDGTALEQHLLNFLFLPEKSSHAPADPIDDECLVDASLAPYDLTLMPISASALPDASYAFENVPSTGHCPPCQTI